MSIQTILEGHLAHVPSFMNAMIGHDGQQFTIPMGIEVEMDADKGTIQMLEKAMAD